MADLMGYKHLTTEALRHVVRAALVHAAREGLPGAHHFYIGFRTDAPHVELSESLKLRYPTEMTIVLQHQFENLEITDDGFSVSLRFGGVPNKLSVPFSAITAFYDPSVEFGLRFDEGESLAQDAVQSMPDAGPMSAMTPLRRKDDNMGDHLRGEVVNLDAFRKK